jgi:hypothetical protein
MGVLMDYLSLFVCCCMCAMSVSELLVTPNNLKSVLHLPADRNYKKIPVLQNGSTIQIKFLFY